MATPGVEAAMELLSRLSGVQDPVEELRNLRVAVESLQPGALRERGSQFPLDGLFVLMAQGDSEQISSCIAILDRFLQAMDPLYVIRHFGEQLQKGLFHQHDSVKILTISQVGRIVEDSDAVKEILNTPELLRQIIYCIAAEKISLAKEAIKSLSRIAQSPEGLEALLEGNLLVDLKNVMAKSDIIRYRVYELVVNIAAASADALNYCVNSGLLSLLIEELTGNDMLVRATCIEMVTTLARTPHGRQYLAQQGVIDTISNIIIGADSDPFSGFYLPGFVKFFGNLAIVDSPEQVCEQYPIFMKKVLSMAEGHDQTMYGVAVDTLGILGSTVEGKLVLQKTGRRFQHMLNRMGCQAKSGPAELRVRCLDALASLLYLPTDEQTDDLVRMMESWFSCLSSQPLELIRNISTQPFPELHCGSLRVFAAIANQPWAQRLMIASPGFVEYVVDRSVDPDKLSKEAKYELVKALANSKTCAEIFGNQHFVKLRGFMHEGPYYVKAVSTTAVEGAD
ncbi:PREDICTED: 26S proteasome non-ATPase regulatory subunit 5 [Gekko japonicus]|uniref:26S proteasome non-ATPase regulatory subunit 5 n=1 Tax=Gekko japonicus TaxID=146911 RepID=A0ABM1KSH0_GEKJA|nr:PREDICTED: 26S proteasome non-ATPase regulatory subunit 5 [Gekko japonicus]